MVRDLQRLLEVVGDVDDGDAAGLEVADDLEQHLDLGGAEGRGRLVHDQDARLDRQRAGDLDDLLLAEAQVLDRRHGVDVLFQLRHEGGGLARLLGVVDAGRAGDLAAHEDVVAHAHVRREAELLVDDGDAAVPRVRRGREDHRLAVELDRAGGGLDDAGQHLHQRRLAGAVLAEQRRHLAGADVEGDALQRVDVAVGFRDVARREDDVADRGIRPGHHFTSIDTGVTSHFAGSVSWNTPTTVAVLPFSAVVSSFDRTCFFISLFRAEPAF